MASGWQLGDERAIEKGYVAGLGVMVGRHIRALSWLVIDRAGASPIQKGRVDG
jgi:hypothetical protein